MAREWREILELAATYGENASDGVSDIAVTSAASKRADGVLSIVDGVNELEGNLVGAIVILAVVELRDDSVAFTAEVVEGVLDVSGGPLGDDTGGGHGTGSEDSEGGREAHDKDG
jgi:hypothetical protein